MDSFYRSSFSNLNKSIILLILLVCSLNVLAQNDTLRVGIAGSAPFVLEGEHPDGLSLDVWEEIASRMDKPFNYIRYNEVPGALERIKPDSLDVLVGPISIIADREKQYDFTQPYFQSSLGIAYLDKPPSLWQRIKPFFSPSFFLMLSLFLIILTVVGTLIWLAERRISPDHFPAKPLEGIGNGIWFALVTMTTVGYGDLAPKTVAGRFITGLWMIIALVSATSLVAGLVSTLTVNLSNPDTIQSAGDMAGQKIGVVSGTSSEKFIDRNAGFKVHVKNIESGMNKLHLGDYKAFVFDRPQLQYYLREYPSQDISLSTHNYQSQGYGFVVNNNAQLLEAMNVSLLELQEKGVLDHLLEEWLPDKN